MTDKFPDTTDTVPKDAVPNQYKPFQSSPGQLGKQISQIDWSKTSLGPISQWPQSLKTSVSHILNSPAPGVIWWGPELNTIYNDAFLPLLREKYSSALGKAGRKAWLDSESWNIIEPRLQQIKNGASSFSSEVQTFMSQRDTDLEETHLTWTYSAIHLENGEVGGVLASATDVTQKILTERRLKTLHELSRRTAQPKTVDEICKIAADVLSDNLADVPFSAIYLFESTSRDRLVRKSTSGLAGDHPMLPSLFDLKADSHRPITTRWPIHETLRTRQQARIHNLPREIGDFPAGWWPGLAASAIAIPVASAESEQPDGILFVGLSPRLPYSSEYQTFLDLVCVQLANACKAAKKEASGRHPITFEGPTEEPIRSNGEPYRILTEASPQIIWESRADGYLTYFNQLWLEFTGLSMEESQGNGWFKALHPDHCKQVQEAWNYATTHGTNFEAEAPVRRASDGAYRWHLARGIPIKDEHGQILKWVGTALDIHEYKLAQEKVAASEQQLSNLIGNVPGAVYRCRNDLDWSMIFVSEGTMKLTGYPPESFTSQEVHYGSLVHPDDVDYVWSQVQRGLQNFTRFTMEYRIVVRDGTVKWVWEQGVGIYDAARELVAIEGLVIDITERKLTLVALEASESRFKLLSNAMPQLVWITNPSGEATYFNQGWSEFFGRETYGLTWQEFVHPDDIKRTWDEFQRASATKTMFKIEYRLRSKEGQYEWFLARATPAFDVTGQITEWFGTCTNIEEQKKVEEELRIAKEVAEQASLAKSQFLTNMSHEIRTPMNGILGFSDLLSDAPLNGEYREYIDRIKANGSHLLQLIDDILDISKVESGKLRLERIEFSASNLISDVFQSMSLLARNKGIDAKLDFAPNAPERLVTDPLRLRQILTNLLSNAIKFTEKGQVKISYKKSETSARAICIEVEDTGIGIDPERASSLFHAFAQADSSITRRFGGTGLGLVLSKRLAEAIGGNLSLKWSKPDQGSCFELLLPIEDVTFAVHPEEGGATAHDQSAQESTLEGLRVLVAEDSPDNIMLLRIYLEKEGIQLQVAHNGMEAIQKATDGDFDMVLMDIQMPLMDGLEATRRLRAQGFDRPIIALTAHALKEEIDKSLAAGCDAHLSKPVSRHDLTSTIRAHRSKDHEAKLSHAIGHSHFHS